MDTKKQQVELSFLLVNYKQEKDIKKLYDQLNSPINNLSSEFLVFDNSNTFSNDKIKSYSIKKNIGFGSAVNFLATKAKGEFFVILNPDVLLKDNFVKVFEDFKNTSIKYGVCSLGGNDTLFEIPLIKFLNTKKRFTSFAFIIHRDIFKSIGGFSSDYFLYFEDDDLAKRLEYFNIETHFPKEKVFEHKKNYTNTSYAQRKIYYYNSLLAYLKKYNRALYLAFFIPLKSVILFFNAIKP